MNLEELTETVKKDVEDQSLEILESIASRIVVIGGWGVRAHLGTGHHRYTLDVDGVADEATLLELRKEFAARGFEEAKVEWGIKFTKKYEPLVEVPSGDRFIVQELELRIEISPPRIKERRTHHHYEFSLTECETKKLPYHSKDRSVKIRVPPIEDMTAVKLGLPVDYKHNHDAALLLLNSDVDEVIDCIKKNDDWSSLVLRRMPKLKGRMKDKSSLEHKLAFNANLNIKEHMKRLEHIEKALKNHVMQKEL